MRYEIKGGGKNLLNDFSKELIVLKIFRLCMTTSYSWLLIQCINEHNMWY